MKEKDIVEKNFLAKSDIFADILNAVYFGGEAIVRPEELKETTELSRFKDDEGRFHEQTRDLAKFWEKEGMAFAFFGVENQTSEDKNMILRVIGYDGATYKNQKENKRIYPVQTIVIYWGREKWTAPRSLRERIEVGEDMKELITDYSYKLIEVSRLSEEELLNFKSDFRQVAEILTKKDSYVPSDEELKHPEETIELLGTILGDERYRTIKEKIKEVKEEGRKVSMCELLDKIETRGYHRGIIEGNYEGKIEGEAKTSTLFVTLIKEGKMEEALRAGEDEEYRKELFELYGL